jgi:hypothetical protein
MLEYVLTTGYAVSGLIAQAMGGTLAQALNIVTDHVREVVLNVPVFHDSIFGVPVGAAWGGLFVLLVGVLLIRR